MVKFQLTSIGVIEQLSQRQLNDLMKEIDSYISLSSDTYFSEKIEVSNIL